MVHLCIFGGHRGQLTPDKRFCISIFGGCELRLPTFARQAIVIRERRQLHLPPPSCFFFTLFAGTSLRAPTLVEEYLDLFEAFRSGALVPRDLDLLTAPGGGHYSPVSSFTLFGGFEDCELPSEEQELEALAMQRHIGGISDQAANTLLMSIGQTGAQRGASLRQAVQYAIAGSGRAPQLAHA